MRSLRPRLGRPSADAWSLIETKSKDELEQMLMAEKKVRNIGEGGMVIEQAEQ